MILTLDVGNTNVVAGVFDGDRLCFVSRLSSSRNRTSDEFAVTLKCLFDIHEISPSAINGSIISSVVPQITNTLAKGITLILGKAPIIVGPGIKTGINIKIDNPAQLGSDMLVDSVAAVAKYPLPCIVIDMGTATSISVVSEKHEFVGCAITPGIKISLDALSDRASQLHGISFSAPAKAIGVNTIESMQSGIVFGNACMIDGMVDRFEKELGKKCSVVATGGYAKDICINCTHDVIIDDYLLLDGLRILYNNNALGKEKK